MADRRTLTPRDLCRLRAVTDVHLHPDGGTVVHVVGWPDAETDANRSLLYACDLDGGNRRRLTEGHRDHLPRFSPDGRRLAFVRATPNESTRIMVASWPLAELSEVASFPDGVDDVRWAGDDRLIALAPRRPDDQVDVDDEELARRPRIVTRIDYRSNGRGWIHDRPRQVFAIDLASDRGDGTTLPEIGSAPREIGSAGLDHQVIAPAPDGSGVAAVVASADDRDLTGATRIHLLDPAPDGAEPVELLGGDGSWSGLVWHLDGDLVASGAVDNSRVGFHRPHRIALPGAPDPGATPLGDADQHIVPAGRVAAPVPGGILFAGNRRGRVGIDRHGLDGSFSTVHQGDDQVVAFDASADGSILVAAVTSPLRPAELWRLDGEPTRLVALNDDLLDELDLAPVEEVTVTSADGTEVHGFVVRPPATAPATEATGGSGGRPGLLYVHGGPMAQYGLGFFDEFQIAAACGYVVVAGNPRGSDGYGEAWARALVGDLGNLDWADVTALADHLSDLDDVDADRLGMGGGSYGGFMTGWGLANDDRFSAGLIERAVTSWTTMFGTSDIGNWFTAKYLEATIEGDAAEVRRQSPLEHAARITTPVLILHSEEDWRCPIEQAEQLFAAIRRNGGDAVFARFPGENHELSRSGRPSHRVERFEIVHEFFARHLGGADFGTDHLPAP